MRGERRGVDDARARGSSSGSTAPRGDEGWALWTQKRMVSVSRAVGVGGVSIPGEVAEPSGDGRVRTHEVSGRAIVSHIFWSAFGNTPEIG